MNPLVFSNGLFADACTTYLYFNRNNSMSNNVTFSLSLLQKKEQNDFDFGNPKKPISDVQLPIFVQFLPTVTSYENRFLDVT